MLATFVIGLREGLEAALIVGIIAAFLTQDGRTRALRSMWIGVGIAAALCVAIGIGLGLLSGALPQRQQEMLETVIGLIAVAMVTWMVLWMRKHSRNLKKELGAAVDGALANGSTFALVAMAFLAVIREGVETAVFLVAASQTRGGTATFMGAGLGIAVAIVLGWLIYRGGVRINLSRFFRATGAVLVLVAGGVLMSSLAHAHEADWLTLGTEPLLDLSTVIPPGSVQESLLGGVLGIQAQLSTIAVLGWLLYVVPMLAVVLWPQRHALSARVTARVLVLVGAVAVVAAVALASLTPSVAAVGARSFALTGDGRSAALTIERPELTGSRLLAVVGGDVRLDGLAGPLGSLGAVVPTTSMTFELVGADVVDGRSVAIYRAAKLALDGTSSATTLTAAQLAALNGGRYPVGLRAADARQQLTIAGAVSLVLSVSVDSATGLPVGSSATVDAAVVATQPGGRTSRVDLGGADTSSDVSGGLAQARDLAVATTRHRTLAVLLPWALGVWGAVLIIAGAAVELARRRRRAAPGHEPVSTPSAPVRHPSLSGLTTTSGETAR